MAANPAVKNTAQRKGASGGTLIDLVASSDGHLFIQNPFPESSRAALDGECWGVLGTTATACVQADPGTAAATVLYNNEPSGGKTYIVHTIGAAGVTNATAIEDLVLYAAVCPSQASLPANTQTTRLGFRAGDTYTGKSRVAFGITLDAAPVWLPFGGFTHASAVADNGCGITVPLKVPFILPPQTGLGLHVVGTSASGTFFHSAMWIEHQFDTTGN